MSSVRFTSALVSATGVEVELPATELTATSSATIDAAGIVTLAARGGPPRRELIWMHDLTGTQVGVVS